jgi:hypothetical protein
MFKKLVNLLFFDNFSKLNREDSQKMRDTDFNDYNKYTAKNMKI